jgi:hypothetical protein
MEHDDLDYADESEPDDHPRRNPRRLGGALSRPLVPNYDVHGIRKPRSILRENLLFFAVFIPLALLGGGIIFLIIHLVR